MINSKVTKEIVLRDIEKQSKIMGKSGSYVFAIPFIFMGISNAIIFYILTRFFDLNEKIFASILMSSFIILLIPLVLIAFFLSNSNIFVKLFAKKIKGESENSILEAGRLNGDWYYYKNYAWNIGTDTTTFDYTSAGLQCDCKYYLYIRKMIYSHDSFELEITKDEYDQLSRVENEKNVILRVDRNCIVAENSQTIFSFA